MRRLLLVIALVASLTAPAAVAADTGLPDPPLAGGQGGMDIEVGKPSLIAKILVRVPVTITCQPKPPSEGSFRSYWENVGLFVWVKQASGRSIALGFAQVYFDPDATCDGLPHTFDVAVAADSSGVPFKSGSAVIAAHGFASWYFENWETGESGWVPQYESTGWMTVRLGR